jgi:hypothetical protein
MKTYACVQYYLSQFFLEWEICQTKLVNKIETHVSPSTALSESRAGYEIMWKNMVQPER